MAFMRRTPSADQHVPAPETPTADDVVIPAADPANAVPLTRAGAAWVGLSAVTLLAILVIVFLVQNTHRVEVSFLWMSASTSLALMVLIATVAGILLTVALGTARIVQLRRLLRGRGTR